MRPSSTRPSISWSDLAGAEVGVWGLGVEGRANVRKLAALGATVVLVDDHPPPDGHGGVRVLRTAGGGLEALGRCQVVVKTPGISRYRREVAELEALGVPVVGGLGLWLQEADLERVVCVIGTKGKSTTTAVLGHLLRGLGHDCFVGGNLGTPPYDDAAAQGADFWIIEASSHQALDMAVSPRTVAVTSLHPDHLDWHLDAETYYRDKLSATSQPGADLTVANGTDELLRARRPLLGPRVEWVVPGSAAPPAWVERLGLLGRHNHVNALVAEACIRALGVPVDDELLGSASTGFGGLESRLRHIGSVEGVDFVDDSLSTNVLPTVAAVEAFPDRAVALLAGGHERHIDYAPLAEYLVRRSSPTLLVALPTSGPRIAAAVRAAGAPAALELVEHDDLSPATEVAFRWALPRAGVVLLSPAAASFDRFRDYRHRAQVFADAMAGCRAAVDPQP